MNNCNTMGELMNPGAAFQPNNAPEEHANKVIIPSVAIGLGIILAALAFERRGEDCSYGSDEGFDSGSLNIPVETPLLIDSRTSVDLDPSFGSASLPQLEQSSSSLYLEALQQATLRPIIEDTLLNRINPGAFLDTALALSTLEVSKTPIPEPTPSGAIRYPILGLPEGVSAELWIDHAPANLDYSGPLMTYHVKVALPEGYSIEGASRRSMEVQIGLWNDSHDQVKIYSALTDISVSGRSPNWDKGILPTGVLFSHDLKNPHDWHAGNCVINNGMPVDSKDQVPTVQGNWPRIDDLNQLKGNMKSQYLKLKGQ